MNHKRFWGHDMSEALRAVRSTLGADALIMETKNLPKDMGGGVEITALAEGPADEENEIEFEVAAPLKAPSQPMDEMRHELAALKSMLGWLAPGLNHQDKIVKTLAAHGLSPELIAKLADAMKQIPHGDERERWFRAIAQLVPTGGQIGTRRDRVALIGPTGVGKTLNVIKLTVCENQRRTGRIGWISADERRLTANDPLAVYAGVLGVQYERAADRKTLKTALDRLAECDLVLIDTPSVNPRDPLSVNALAKLFQGLTEVRRILLLSAVSNANDLVDWIAGLRQVGTQSLIFTKLDECRYFGPLLHAVLTAALPVSYLSLGQNLAGDLELAQPEIFASLLLTGVDTHD
jgi:flagellar biosynthesis protein FlhF